MREYIAENDVRTLRDISAVVGGDHNDMDLLERRAEEFLRSFRTAMNRIFMHQGFSSTGSLTDALNHPSFIESTNSLENGLVIDQLLNYADPTTVLDAPQEVLRGHASAIQSVYGSVAGDQIAVQNRRKETLLASEFKSSNRIGDTVIVSKRNMSTTGEIIGENAAAGS